MTNTITIDIDDNSVRTGDALLRLDALIEGYEEVLQQARRQLEHFEINDDDWNRLAHKLERVMDYGLLASRLTTRIADTADTIESAQHGQGDPEANHLMTRLLDTLTNRVTERINNSLLSHAVRSAVAAATQDLRDNLETLALQAVEERCSADLRQAQQRAHEQTFHLRQVLVSCMGEELEAMSRRAAADLLQQQQQQHQQHEQQPQPITATSDH